MADFRIDSVNNLYGVDGRGCMSDEMPGCPVEADGGCIRTNINYLTASLRHSTSVRAVSDADCFCRITSQKRSITFPRMGIIRPYVLLSFANLTYVGEDIIFGFPVCSLRSSSVCRLEDLPEPSCGWEWKTKLQNSTFGCLSATTLVRKQRSCQFA